MYRIQFALLFTVPLTLAGTGCAHLAHDDKAPNLTITADEQDAKFDPVPFRSLTGLADYKVAGGAQKVEWIACSGKASKAAILIAHSERAGYDAKRFCAGWIAQTFLAQGLDVVTVNRPGFGASTGTPDFWGPTSNEAVRVGIEAALAKGIKPLQGAWGYDTGAAAAVAFAKQWGKLSWLILGGGVYDLEQTEKATSDSDLRKQIETIRKTGGDKALEDRSVGYDVSGLPKRLLIYHGKLDTVAPTRQAQAFGDALQAGGYQSTFQQVDGVKHDMAWSHHRKLLEVMARSIGG